jgi:hypothetical protein
LTGKNIPVGKRQQSLDLAAIQPRLAVNMAYETVVFQTTTTEILEIGPVRVGPLEAVPNPRIIKWADRS